MISQIIPTDTITDLSENLLQPDGHVKLMPASEWRSHPWNDFRAFCHLHARYGIPTTETVEFLHAIIRGRRAIEIGAGAGDLGHHLGIPMTDSKLQENPLVREHYTNMGQPVIVYPPDVEYLEAMEAVERYAPEVVVASWVTAYAPHPMPYESSPFGIREQELLSLVDTYILVGNTDIHRTKPIMGRTHATYRPKWLVSRASRQENNRIWIWHRDKTT